MIEKQHGILCELKLEEKVMNLCHIPTHSIKNQITTSQAIMLRAIAPKVADQIFSKKFYNNLFSALKDELTLDPVQPEQGPERIQAILMCFAEICAHVPTHEYVVINEEILEFYLKCVKRGTQGLYIDLIQYYCQNTSSTYEKNAHFYAANVL